MADGYMRVLPVPAAIDSIKEAWTAFQQAERGLFSGPSGLSARGAALQSCQQNIPVRHRLLESAKADEARSRTELDAAKDLQVRETLNNRASAASAQAKAAHTAAKAALAEAERIVRDLTRARPASVCEVRELLLRDVSSKRCKTTSNFAPGSELIKALEGLCAGQVDALAVTAVESLGDDEDARKEIRDMLVQLKELVPQSPLVRLNKALTKDASGREKVQYLHGMHYLGDLDFFRPGAEPLIDAMHAFFRFMDSITKMLLKSIRAFMKSCRWGFGAKAEKISRLSVFRPFARGLVPQLDLP